MLFAMMSTVKNSPTSASCDDGSIKMTVLPGTKVAVAVGVAGGPAMVGVGLGPGVSVLAGSGVSVGVGAGPIVTEASFPIVTAVTVAIGSVRMTSCMLTCVSPVSSGRKVRVASTPLTLGPGGSGPSVRQTRCTLP